ncbi:hypothetical protein [Ruminiclostridium cellobioparum]|uniref:hypothetical protein n=1 Tax=Ruminiclostridium cellobioparum TaxID=29355 RepID=UPI0028AEB3E5|nr:hypothetical protein [Ruminiclostridium cellobioparum]
MTDKYDDIIHLPHHTSSKHPRMSSLNRAAQFAPFAALSGYDDAVKETARLTDERVELDEYTKNILSNKLQLIAERFTEQPEVVITYFQPDQKKDGGDYVTATGIVKKIDEYNRIVVMTNGIEIPIEEIINIEGHIFENIYDE